MERLTPDDFPKLGNTPTHPTTRNYAEDSRVMWVDMPVRPMPDCPQCKGAGYVHPRKLNGEIDASRIIPCNWKGCLGEKMGIYRKEQLKEHSGIMMTKQTFENFNPLVPGVRKSFEAAKKIAEGDSDFVWLLFYGGVGSGKTHLLNAIANRVLERGKIVKFIMMAELLSELRMAIEEKQVDFKMKVLKEVPYLIIDELGLEYGTPWEQEKIDELLTIRWANGRFTIAATNLDIEALPERIRSRFKDRYMSRYVLNEGGDYRIRKGQR